MDPKRHRYIRMTIVGSHNEPDERALERALQKLAADLSWLGVKGAMFHVEHDAIAFASDAARELAAAMHVSFAELTGLKPTSKKGYTTKDVRHAGELRDA